MYPILRVIPNAFIMCHLERSERSLKHEALY